MQRRSESRFIADQAIWVTLLGKGNARIPGRIRNISGRGVGFEVGEPIGTGTPIQIDFTDALLLGEAIFCREENGRYYVGAELDHALYGLAELAKALREFDESPAKLEENAVDRRVNRG